MMNKLYSFLDVLGLRKMIMLFFGISLIIVSLIMSVIVFMLFENELLSEVKGNLARMLSETNRQIVYSISHYEELLYHLCLNRDIQEILNSEVGDSHNKHMALTEITGKMQPYKSANANLKRIEIFPENTDWVDDSLMMSKHDAWYISMMRKPPSHTEIKFVRLLEYKVNGVKVEEDVILMSRQIYDLNNRRVLGVMRFYISIKEISYMLDNFTLLSGGIAFLMDSERNIMYKGSQYDPEILGLLDSSLFGDTNREIVGRFGNEKWWIASAPQRKGDTYVIVLVSNKSFRDRFSHMYKYFIINSIVILIFGYFFSYTVSRFITFGHVRLIRKIKAISEGDYDVSAMDDNTNYKGEMGNLHLQINIMAQKIETLIRDVYQEKITRRDNEIRLMQSQINSHFLYNTLSSINWMAINISAFDISRAVNALARYYRLTLSKGKEIITVDEEIKHVKSYITIQKLRFKDRFEVFYDIPEEILGCYTAKVILQPFVENSIVHGFDTIKYQGKINISGRKKQDVLEFIVEDNGRGLLNNIGSDEIKQSDGFGVRHIDEKIKLLFGPEFGVKISDSDSGGVKIAVTIPVITRYPPGETGNE